MARCVVAPRNLFFGATQRQYGDNKVITSARLGPALFQNHHLYANLDISAGTFPSKHTGTAHSSARETGLERGQDMEGFSVL